MTNHGSEGTQEAMHPNIKIVQDYLAAVGRKDFAAATAMFTPDVAYHVPGHSLVSGDSKGPQNVMGALSKLMELSSGTYSIKEFRDWLTSTNRVLLMAQEHAERNGKTLDWTRLILFELKDGKMANIATFEDDLDAFDAFWS